MKPFKAPCPACGKTVRMMVKAGAPTKTAPHYAPGGADCSGEHYCEDEACGFMPGCWGYVGPVVKCGCGTVMVGGVCPNEDCDGGEPAKEAA